MKLSAAAFKVIELAAKIRSYYTVEKPKWHPDYPIIRPEDPMTPPPPEERELKEFLRSLSPEMVYQLAFIALLGRGTVDASDLRREYQAMKEDFSTPDQIAAHLVETAPLADLLSDGLVELQRFAINVDKSPFPPMRRRVSKK